VLRIYAIFASNPAFTYLNNQYLRPQLVYNIYKETSEAEILIYRDYIQN